MWLFVANTTALVLLLLLLNPGTVLKGVPNNVEFLRRLVTDPRFIAGDTTTKFLEDFNFTPRVAEIILPGEQGPGGVVRQQL
jgi:acetyl/propionyl-CoA carboxylase alpha subunit